MGAAQVDFRAAQAVFGGQGDIAALEDLVWWIRQDRNKALRIVNLLKDVLVTHSKGLASQNR